MGYIPPGQADLPFEIFEEEILAPIKGVDLTDLEYFVAVKMLRATTDFPIKQQAIIHAARVERNVELSERQVRTIVHRLRNDHGFPICSRKRNPAGYWWGRTEAELEEFASVFIAQLTDEYHTVRKMLKTNYPRLAGQLRLGLEE